MKSTPLLFKPEMIRACLDGRKRMTRRLVNPQPPRGARIASYSENGVPTEFVLADRHGDPIDAPPIKCRYGLPGDEIWSRENFASGYSEGCWGTIYGADGVFIQGPRRHEKGPHYNAEDRPPMKWRPSIHQPRWASRFVRTLTQVRVERLQSITERDAELEGVTPNTDERELATEAFVRLWDSINGDRAPWASNPWVWVLEW